MNVPPANTKARTTFELLRAAPLNATRWDWYALLRLVQAQATHQPPIGYGIQLSHDPVRLGQPPFMHPPQTTVASLKFKPPQEPGAVLPANASIAWINSFHFGLLGPRGPLPLHLTEYAYTHSKAGDFGFASFCNVLHHRFLCFFFRAWADSRKEVELDRRRTDSNSGLKNGPVQITWESFVGSLVGIGLPSMRDQDTIPHHAKLYYSGRLAAKTRTLEGLQAILDDFFEAPVQVLAFRPTRNRIPDQARWKLGGGTMMGHLGLSLIAGETVQNFQDGFRIRIGPLHTAQFNDFLPESPAFAQLRDWIRLYLGRETDPNDDLGIEAAWDLQLVLAGEDVPPMKLGSGVFLGWSTWLHSAPPKGQIADLVIHPSSKPSLSKTLRPTGRTITTLAA